MQTFTMQHEGHRHKMAIVSLHPATPQIKSDNTAYYCSCGAYARQNGRMEYRGVSLHGNIPIVALVRWARRKGFLAWESHEV